MSNIVFTQDVQGERDWLQSLFPECVNFETVGSGKWPDSVPATSGDVLYEIAYSDTVEYPGFLHFPANKYKSIYNSQPGFNDKHWYYADILLSEVDFDCFKDLNNPYSIVCTFSRCGSELTEDLLLTRFKPLAPHFVVGSNEENQANVDKIVQAHDVTVVLVYRKSWWDWIISSSIKRRYGAYHYYDNQAIDELPPFDITEEFILESQNEVLRTWDFWCNLRVKFPEHDFYLLEFSDIVNKYAKLSSHQALRYNKERIIGNYHQAKQLFESKYLNDWITVSERCRSHLINMGCHTDMGSVFNQTQGR